MTVRLASAAVLAAAPALAQIAPPPDGNAEAARIVEAAAATCAEERSGPLFVEPEAYVPHDLDGDGDMDLVIDHEFMGCARNVAAFGGSGGTLKSFVLDGTASVTWQGGPWHTVDLPEGLRLILLPVHGTWCDGAGATPCYRAIAASGGELTSIVTAPE